MTDLGAELLHFMKWQPIETAPKNRMLLVGFYNGAGKWRSAHAQFYENGLPEHDDSDELVDPGWYEGSLEAEMLFPIHRPTHWMPLPPAPTITGVQSLTEGSKP